MSRRNENSLPRDFDTAQKSFEVIHSPILNLPMTNPGHVNCKQEWLQSDRDYAPPVIPKFQRNLTKHSSVYPSLR